MDRKRRLEPPRRHFRRCFHGRRCPRRLRWSTVLGLQQRCDRLDLLELLRLEGDLSSMRLQRLIRRLHSHLCRLDLRHLAQHRPLRRSIDAVARDDPPRVLVMWRRARFKRGPSHPIQDRVRRLDQPSHRVRFTGLKQHVDVLQLEPPQRCPPRQRPSPLPPNLRFEHMLRLLVHRRRPLGCAAGVGMDLAGHRMERWRQQRRRRPMVRRYH